MRDTWQAGHPYEYYMGRWSKLVAEKFVAWLSPGDGLHWLDVGCGTGALSEVIVNGRNPATVVAIDQSEGFVRSAEQRLGSAVACRVANALALPLDDATMDMTVSGLVLNFIPDPGKALAEMRRVTRRGGTVAVYVWDYAGEMEFLTCFWDTAVELDPTASTLHEGRRFPDSNAGQLAEQFARAGFTGTESTALEIVTRFADFDDYWQPFLGGQGPAPSYVAGLGEAERGHLREALARRLPLNGDGSISLAARAWATKGVA